MSRNYPTVRVLFDRKHVATKNKVGLVQLEVAFGRKRKFISTGVKVYKDQWNERVHVTNRIDMNGLNVRIQEAKGQIDDYINGLLEKGKQFDFDAFDRWLFAMNERKVSFIDWLAEQIDRRTDIQESSKRTQHNLVSRLREFGRIVSFDELTKANVMLFDDFLHDKGLKQTSVFGYHKTLKTYIHEAMRRELIGTDPYSTLRFDRGKGEWGRFLDKEELQRVEEAKMPTESIARVRDLFLLQCFTGLSYSDLMAFDFTKVKTAYGQQIYTAERKKTGVQFTVPILPKTLAILERYGYELPKISNEQYNLRLKIMAEAAHIDKPLASHWGRRTCGMVLLNEGFSIEVVAKVLGHANIKTTQEAYARILDDTVAREFAKWNG